jgi:DNA invertase Pin-like site-specific DNA recombinase
MPKTCILYARVSTSSQTTENQLLALRTTAQRMGWKIVAELVDDGISGSKGKDERPAFDRLHQMIQRRECDVVMVWSIDRLGRSMAHLVEFMDAIQAVGVDLYAEKQALNTATPAGRMVFGIFSALAEFEREIIRERVRTGIARAKANGIKCGRPSNVNDAVKSAVRLLRDQGKPIRQIARTLNIGVGTTYNILAAA